MRPMTNRLQPPIQPQGSFGRGEVLSLEINLQEAVLKAFAQRIKARLTGPESEPVFIPQNDPKGQNYRGLL